MGRFVAEAELETKAANPLSKEETLFTMVHKIINHLRSTGETLDTVINKLSPEPQCGEGKASGGPPNLFQLLEDAVFLSKEVNRSANRIAQKIGNVSPSNQEGV